MLAALPLVSTLLTALPAEGRQPTVPDCAAAPATVELRAEPGAPPPVVCLTPGKPTTLLFDTPLSASPVEVQSTAQEVRVVQAAEVLLLLPAAWLEPAQWRRLTVHFAEKGAPAVATLWLYIHPAWGAWQVEVRRQARTVESYQQEVVTLQQQLVSVRQENAQLRAAQGIPEGLRGLLSEGLMAVGGIASADLFLLHRVSWRKSTVFKLSKMFTYRSTSRVAVDVKLTLLPGAQPWVAEGAVLVDAQGRELPVLPLWQEPTPETMQWARVVVEAQATPNQAAGPYTLKLWAQGGTRSITLEGVSFPPLPSAPAQ